MSTGAWALAASSIFFVSCWIAALRPILVLVLEALEPERVLDGDEQLVRRQRLLDEVVGAELGGLHGGLDGAVAAHDDDGRLDAGVAGLAQHLEAVDVGHLDVEEREVVAPGAQPLEPERPAARDVRVVALEAQRP
jgi:hypothetical protein